MKSNLLKFLKHDASSNGNQKHKSSITAREVYEGFTHLLKIWSFDAFICKLLLTAFEKTLRSDSLGPAIARESGQSENCIFQRLRVIFSSGKADCEVKLAIISLWQRITDEDGVHAENHVTSFVEMVLSFLAESANIENVSQVCFRSLQQVAKGGTDMSKKELLSEKNQAVMLQAYDLHSRSGMNYILLIPLFYRQLTL